MDEELELTRAQLAQRIGFSQSVIRKWEKDFAEFVTSPAGVKGLAKARVYNLDDVLLFGTVAQLRSEGLPLDRIRELLPDRLAQARTRVDEALGVNPLDAALGEDEEPSPRVHLALYMDTARQLEATEGELRAVSGERDYLRERLRELEDRLLDAERRAAAATAERDMLAARPTENEREDAKPLTFWQRFFGGSRSE